MSDLPSGLPSDKNTGLPPLPFYENLTGTRFEIQMVEQQFKLNWKNGPDNFGGLTNRHRDEVRRYLINMARYALEVGVTEKDLEYCIDLAVMNHKSG